MDDHGHGTHCAGTIGAKGNNGIGVVGVNWDVKIMAVKWIGADGWGYTDGAIEAIEYAHSMGADIIEQLVAHLRVQPGALRRDRRHDTL